MATFVLDGPLGEGGSPGAAAGLALSTTAAFAQLPPGTQHVVLEGRNYTTAVVALVKLNPYLVVLRNGNRPDCPGDAPVIVHSAADETTINGLTIAADISAISS